MILQAGRKAILSRAAYLLLLLCCSSSREQAFERAQPFRQSVLVVGAEPVVVFFTDELHALIFALADRIDLHSVQDLSER